MNSIRTYSIATICLLVGALLYATCRTEILFVNLFHLNNLPHLDLSTASPWVYWLVFCLPDGLWYFALLLLQHRFTQKESFLSHACFWTAVALPFILEGMQAAGLIFGTFDYCDMLTYLFTLIVFLCLRKKL